MNVWILSGKIGKDAETRTLDSGKTVISFSLATDDLRLAEIAEYYGL